ncbi:MAG: PIN domain-containing protein [Patescibacteria group bacterium]
MTKSFVDTNIFLRFLVKEDEQAYNKSFALFKKASEGKINLITSSLVIFEIIWTLESFYKVKKSDIVGKVLGILNLPNLEVEKAELLFQALI